MDARRRSTLESEEEEGTRRRFPVKVKKAGRCRTWPGVDVDMGTRGSVKPPWLATSSRRRQGSNSLEDDYCIATTIHNESKQLLTLMDDVLNFSKLEAEETDIVEEPLLIAPWMDRYMTWTRTNDVFRGMSIGYTLELLTMHRRTMYVNRMYVEQILKNLLSNICKYTQGGEVILRVKELPPEGEDGGGEDAGASENGGGGEKILGTSKDGGGGGPGSKDNSPKHPDKDNKLEGTAVLLVEIQAENISAECCSWLLEAESRGQGGVRPNNNKKRDVLTNG
eukprot:457338-Prorocentrum_minimum.AAC.1